MASYKPIYVFFILVALLFYLIGIYYAYELVNDGMELYSLMKTLSSMSFSFNILNYTLIEKNSVLKLDMITSFNITWKNPTKLRGPVIKIVYKGKELGTIDIEKLNKPVIDKKIRILLDIRKEDVNKTIYLNILIISSLGNISLIQPFYNVSSLIKLSSISIQNIEKQFNKISFYLVTPYKVNVPAKIILYDSQHRIIIDKHYFIDKNPYKIEIGLDPASLSKAKYIAVEVYGVTITETSIGD